ncbi:MAG: serine hydrolase domain-containing protein [Vicinamibacterales bacterium]
MSRSVRYLLASLAVLSVPWLVHAQSGAARFDQYVESLRQQAGIPGLSAAIVQHGTIVWEKGFGEADLERNVPVTPDTPFPIAGLTVMVSAVQALRCVEEGQLELAAPVQRISPTFGDPTVTLQDVLAHVIAGHYAYDLQRYDAVATGIKACTGKTLRAALVDNVLERFGMNDSVPGHDFNTWSASTLAQFPDAVVDRYRRTMERMAKPYRSAGRGSKPAPTSFAPSAGLVGGSGLVSTVHDVAMLQAALDAGALLRSETRSQAFVAPVMADGKPSPHALGWFVQKYEGQTLAWQFGEVPDGYSALLMTLPERGVTLILLANSDGLVEPFRLVNGDVSVSPFARLFLGLFS